MQQRVALRVSPALRFVLSSSQLCWPSTFWHGVSTRSLTRRHRHFQSPPNQTAHRFVHCTPSRTFLIVAAGDSGTATEMTGQEMLDALTMLDTLQRLQTTVEEETYEVPFIPIIIPESGKSFKTSSKTCLVCSGTGFCECYFCRVEGFIYIGPDSERDKTTCPACAGNAKSVCRRCDGTGITPDDDPLGDFFRDLEAKANSKETEVLPEEPSSKVEPLLLTEKVFLKRYQNRRSSS
mmetsp:Transcript_39365/g.63844  ORF Transcript_39365/g.63844 Transcript_39365/m.63844 type:complete len:236 (+) Transcript_39365:158-865(+)